MQTHVSINGKRSAHFHRNRLLHLPTFFLFFFLFFVFIFASFFGGKRLMRSHRGPNGSFFFVIRPHTHPLIPRPTETQPTWNVPRWIGRAMYQVQGKQVQRYD